MNVSDLQKYLNKKTLKSLGDTIGLSKGSMSIWNSNGIPLPQQAILQVRTGGDLKSEIKPDLKREESTNVR